MKIIVTKCTHPRGDFVTYEISVRGTFTDSVVDGFVEVSVNQAARLVIRGSVTYANLGLFRIWLNLARNAVRELDRYSFGKVPTNLTIELDRYVTDTRETR